MVGLFIGSLGTVGVIWIFTGLYLFSGVLMKFVTLPKESATAQEERGASLAKIS